MASLGFKASGAAQVAVENNVPHLVADQVASKIAAKDATLWGAEAESEASIRLGWVDLFEASRALVPLIEQTRAELASRGVDRIVLAGMGGSSLAPEVITKTAGVELHVLDSTDPGMVASVLEAGVERTALVVSSKSGSTVETDSQRRIFEKYYADAGINPAERIIVVTDPGSPLESSAREAGYRVFVADPTVGGRYSALTAFGLVPSGLAGVDIDSLLNDAEAASKQFAADTEDNLALQLGAALGGTRPLRDKLIFEDQGSGIVGFADWAEQLIAESTGKEGTGLLPVVVQAGDPEVTTPQDDFLEIKLVSSITATEYTATTVEVSGNLGAQMVLWEYATVIASYLLDINPFDQPDVESAKIATRGLLESRPAVEAPLFTDGSIEVRATAGLLPAEASSVEDAISALLGELSVSGYLAVQAYTDRLNLPALAGLRSVLAGISGRPVTFGWGPRFLHSTGQFHKGGPAVGVFLQITASSDTDLEIPGLPFTLGQLINAQATGDASVLTELGQPVLRLHLTDRTAAVSQLASAVAAVQPTQAAQASS
ncbi:glucose-6-phosphate isomerase [Neomicrococcus aestuarii]|uniref:Glucose-6-phosphate isomerase n=1 Tax=Neomicrococcus aestuarii TaxID=556325 RepID=A0A7W8TS95_9MICC|nr:glucose-6-phosphate isomerase [Neomicrococcus aestuarii]MBB5511823.1 glucose-6-phosphate isomerase [Neomicrococcus aestuarii]